MKLHGYGKNPKELIEIEKISVQLSTEELSKLIDFLSNVKQATECSDDFGHEHFSDYAKELNLNCDIILFPHKN